MPDRLVEHATLAPPVGVGNGHSYAFKPRQVLPGEDRFGQDVYAWVNVQVVLLRRDGEVR